MTQKYRACRFATLTVVAALFLTAVSAAAQEPEGVNQLEDWQQEELISLIEEARQTITAPAAGPAAFELGGFASQIGTDGDGYVAYTVTIDPSKISTPTVAMYMFLLDPASIAAVSADENGDSDEAPELPDDAFEYYDFIDVASGGTEPVQISRALTAPGGEYEIFIAIRDSSGGEEVEDDAVQSAPLLLRESVTVPDFWNGTLQTSTVLIPDSLEQLQIPLTPDQLQLSPYTIAGVLRIEPKFDRVFGKQDELSLIFVVYNAGSEDGSKPNLQIEYNFHQQTADGEEFFNQTQPQEFNAETLPPGFDLSMGHMLPVTQSVPLSLFPAGDYRLEIKLIDTAGSTELIHNVMFTVEEA